jgi:inorganic pyrophosphatase
MSRIAVAVESTVGTMIGRQGPDHLESERWPVGRGRVADTLGADRQPVDALVLMCEPALPGVVVQARPVAVLRLIGSDRETEELICVAADEHFDDLVDVADLERWHADPAAWAAALGRLSPGSAGVLVSCGRCAEAERLLAEAQDDYSRMTGSLEWS